MRRGLWLCAAAAAALGCGGDSAGPRPGTLFATPLLGTLNQTFFYLNYVDETPGGGLRDYNCGPKTYDGHLGTDITLPSFAVMDAGVSVVAAAPGTVVATHDDEFDRQKSWTPGAVWNFVTIRHADDVQTIYGHLKAGSILVNTGQALQAGTVLGQVGSSGRSDIPHLHFEVQGPNEDVLDPWAGGCGASESRWSAQLPYQNAFSLVGSGLTNETLTLDRAKDPPPQVETFSTTDARVTLWVELVNVPAGTPAEFRLIRPDDTHYATYQFTHSSFYSLSWWWAWFAISGSLTEPGTWRMQYWQNGARLAERSFVLVVSPLARAAPAPAASARAGFDGGGVGKPRP